MPSYVIEFDSNHGPERRLFTLDDDRPLDTQLYQVLEELRQSGRVLQGAPGDELGVSWNGLELDQRPSLGSLGVDASRPLILRMRPRAVAVVAPSPVVVSKYGLRHIVLPPVEGALGALVAWALSGAITDARGAITSADRADVVVAMMLAGLVGLALGIGSVMRGLYRMPVAVLCTLVSAAGGLLILVALLFAGESPSVKSFVLARIVAWTLITMAVALVITAPLRDLGVQRFIEAAAIALIAGVLSALVSSLPGVSDLWRAFAFMVGGALVGAAAISIPVWRTASVYPRAVAAA
ncbi:MAG: hypothetical protein ABIW79_03135 [Gemmatimonas sp.]